MPKRIRHLNLVRPTPEEADQRGHQEGKGRMRYLGAALGAALLYLVTMIGIMYFVYITVATS